MPLAYSLSEAHEFSRIQKFASRRGDGVNEITSCSSVTYVIFVWMARNLIIEESMICSVQQ